MKTNEVKKNIKMEILDNKKLQEKYIKAQNRIKELKKFYKHLAVYIIVNVFLVAIKMVKGYENAEPITAAFSNIRIGSFWFWWGIALAIHAFKTFGYDILFGKNWEERKIKELMDKD